MQHFGIIGHPLGHSQSKRFFDAYFASHNIAADYTVHELDAVEDVVPLLHSLDGLNVTSPYKELIIPYLDEIDDIARAIGAVNVVYHHRGYNTDWLGAVAALKPHIRKTDRQALVLGTGGAAHALQYALQQLGLTVELVSRYSNRGELTYAELTPEVMRAHTVIVNCTPLGMFPHESEAPDIPYNQLSASHLLFDCIYNPEQTVFMQRGKQHGALTVNGQAMFLAQANEAINIFRI